MQSFALGTGNRVFFLTKKGVLNTFIERGPVTRIFSGVVKSFTANATGGIVDFTDSYGRLHRYQNGVVVY